MSENKVTCESSENKKINISLCIPVYNVKPYLDNLLKSIIVQKNDNFEYEMLFIDDCSTDGSFEHLCEITKEIKNAQVIKNDVNSGISYTRNRLLDNSSGEYIWFIDSDDMIYPNALQSLYNIASQTGADMVLANYIKVSEDAGVIETQDIVPIEYKRVSTDNYDWLPDKNNECRMLSMCRGIFKKDFFCINSLRFNEKVIMKEDALLYYEMGMKFPKAIKCEFPCYCVRQRASSAMHGINEQKAKKYFYSSLALADAYQKHLDAQNYIDKNKVVNLIETEKEQLVKYLLWISDKKFVNEKFNFLKNTGLYPYKPISSKSAGAHKMIELLLRFAFGFRLFYYLYGSKRNSNK